MTFVSETKKRYEWKRDSNNLFSLRMTENTFYITTAISYPNAKPHMGHAYEAVLTDVLARYYRLAGKDTYFLTGTDENSEKVVLAAKKVGKKPADFTNDVVGKFKDFYSSLNISYNQFIRTSDEEKHWPGVTELWKRLKKSKDLYKGTYKGIYCVGCEAFITEKELVDGKCPDHDTVPKKIEEENYFFKLSKYSDEIKKKIEEDELKVIPETRKNEILSLLNEGLQDSFSRPKKAIPWGIPVPGDDSQVIYVWCDALTNYISALGFGRKDDANLKKFWPAQYHVIGKDILRFHVAIWPGMLLSAGVELPRAVFVHGFITSGGKKMSKERGNVLDPTTFIDEYGADAVRYYLVREISPFEDGDMTEEKFKDSYNGNLANGIGNLVSRIMKMIEQYDIDTSELVLDDTRTIMSKEEVEEYHDAFEVCVVFSSKPER